MANKLPINIFVNPAQREKVSINDYQSQALDPFSTMREGLRENIFSSTRTKNAERLVEVIAVDNDVKIPAELSYYSNRTVATELNNRTYISVIGRIGDIHGGTPEPDMTVDAAAGTTTLSFKDITRTRSSLGRFYAPKEDMAGKSIGTVEVGDILLVQFQDPLALDNGIIKKVFQKKNLSTYLARGGGGAGGAFAPGAGGVPLGGTPVGILAGDIIFIGGSMCPLLGAKVGAPETSYRGHGLQQDGSNMDFLLTQLAMATPSTTITKVIINVGGNDGFTGTREKVQQLHTQLTRVFPSAPFYFVMWSPYHILNAKFAPNRSPGDRQPKQYYLGGNFTGFHPQAFFIFHERTAMTAPVGNQTHAGHSGTWGWPGGTELVDLTTKILSGQSLTPNEVYADANPSLLGQSIPPPATPSP